MRLRALVKIAGTLIYVIAGCAWAQTPSLITSFSGTNGSSPISLIEAPDGFLYGTTESGGGSLGMGLCFDTNGTDIGCGTAFKMDRTGRLTIVHSFMGLDGASPTSMVVFSDGRLYGTTTFGGSSINQKEIPNANNPTSASTPSCIQVSPVAGGQVANVGCGTIFSIGLDGSFSSLYSFPGSVNAANPNGGAVEGTENGSFPNGLIVGYEPDVGPVLFGSTLGCNGTVGYPQYEPTNYNCIDYGALGGPSSILFSIQPDKSNQPVIIANSIAGLEYPTTLLQASDANLYVTTAFDFDPGGDGFNEPCDESVFLSTGACGGLFKWNISAANTTSQLAPVCDMATAANAPQESPDFKTTPRKTSGRLSPLVVIRQPGRGFPTANWSFSVSPIQLIEGKDNSFYGINPIFVPPINSAEYSVTFQCNPNEAPPSWAIPPYTDYTWGTFNAITLLGQGPSPQGPDGTLQTASDGLPGGFAAITLGSNGNFYGVTSNDISPSSPAAWFSISPDDVQASIENGPLTQLSAAPQLLPGSEGNYSFNSIMQASDGSFYATSSDTSNENGGGIFRSVISNLTGPLALTISKPQIILGSSVTLTWSVANAFSLTAQQCYAFVQNAAIGAGAWTGSQSGSVAEGKYSGSATIYPTAAGAYTYVLTCGGTESNFATLAVTPPTALKIGTPGLPTGTIGVAYPTTELMAAGGIPPYQWTITSGSLPQTMSLASSTGVLSGTPVQSGSFSLTIQVSDSQSTPAKASLSLVLQIDGITSTPVFSLRAGTYGSTQSVSVTDATGGAEIYYTIDGTTPTTSSARYTIAIPISSTETIQAIAVASGYANSPIASASYVIEKGALQFVPVTPCRIVDTRHPAGDFAGPELAGGSVRTFNIPKSNCDVPSTAVAYSLNATVVPIQKLGYLTVWPAGQTQPNVSTLNSDGRVKANATITPAGTSGGVSVYVTDATQFILDIDGYFVVAGTAPALAFYPLKPCRVADTRGASGPLGGPTLTAGSSRAFSVLASACNIPATAQAYSLNVTALPQTTLNYLTSWPTGQAQPNVSTLNSSTGTITANAAIVPAGSGGDVSIFVSDTADLLLDVNGYFAPPGTGGLSLYALAPCRVIDTRKESGAFNGLLTINIAESPCAPSPTAQSFVLNATVVPAGPLNFLTLWPTGEAQPNVSTLNATDGAITSNMAIVLSSNDSIDALAYGNTNLILDISSYFAP